MLIRSKTNKPLKARVDRRKQSKRQMIRVTSRIPEKARRRKKWNRMRNHQINKVWRRNRRYSLSNRNAKAKEKESF